MAGQETGYTYRFRDGQGEAFMGHLRSVAESLAMEIRDNAGDARLAALDARCLLQVLDLMERTGKASGGEAVLSHGDMASLAVFAVRGLSGGLFSEEERERLRGFLG